MNTTEEVVRAKAALRAAHAARRSFPAPELEYTSEIPSCGLECCGLVGRVIARASPERARAHEAVLLARGQYLRALVARQKACGQVRASWRTAYLERKLRAHAMSLGVAS